ncbi:heme ABC transporter ATP-binding protein [Brevibacillus sp. TJ4]|uniref:heme ABC transporter ATP-binding protein n=1 Tax=Brevibacillus sp. TJ4 TaxID=3234853 RepID=UPI0037D44ABB
MNDVAVRAERVSLSLDKKKILHQIDLELGAGEIVGLLGPNGSGKSTLLKSIYRVMKPDAGWIYLEGEDVYGLSAKECAQRMAVVRQESSVDFDFRVDEVVWMGRSPHKKLFEPDGAEDRHICEEALRQVGMLDYAKRSFFTLSGGEKQRVMIARALAQQAKVLVLDEPTNHLDVRYQLQIMDLVQELGIPTLAALHDLNIAAAYCDRLLFLHEGEIVASGAPEQILTPALIRDVFGVEAEVTTHPVTGKKHVYFFSGAQKAATTGREVAVLG